MIYLRKLNYCRNCEEQGSRLGQLRLQKIKVIKKQILTKNLEDIDKGILQVQQTLKKSKKYDIQIINDVRQRMEQKLRKQKQIQREKQNKQAKQSQNLYQKKYKTQNSESQNSPIKIQNQSKNASNKPQNRANIGSSSQSSDGQEQKKRKKKNTQQLKESVGIDTTEKSADQQQNKAQLIGLQKDYVINKKKKSETNAKNKQPIKGGQPKKSPTNKNKKTENSPTNKFKKAEQKNPKVGQNKHQIKQIETYNLPSSKIQENKQSQQDNQSIFILEDKKNKKKEFGQSNQPAFILDENKKKKSQEEIPFIQDEDEEDQQQ